MKQQTASASEKKRGDHKLTDQFETMVLGIERAAIRARRDRLSRKDADRPESVGLALSGGGIRSASFCLGVIQALEAREAFSRIDYLSTVSGGGYTGCCVTACMSRTEGKFPFNVPKSYADTEAVHHIRDYSNYLIPGGAWDVVTAIGILARGLVANLLLLLPFVLTGVVVLLSFYPTLDGYGRMDEWFGEHLWCWLYKSGFPVTIALLALDLLFLVFWVFQKSSLTSDIVLSGRRGAQGGVRPELQNGFIWIWKALVLVTLVTAWLEFQPIALRLYANPPKFTDGCWTDLGVAACAKSLLAKWLTAVAPSLAPLAAVVAFLSKQIGQVAQGTVKQSAFAKKLSAKALLYLTAALVPSLIWLIYLALAWWLQQREGVGAPSRTFIEIAIASWALVYFINPNATSLHRFYRDRLTSAFWLDPGDTGKQIREWRSNSPKLHEIDPTYCPYPIVNAALNLEGSAFANRRGRNADFFEFTPEFCGSEATQYIGSKRLSEAEPKLDLGTAMAISGAAFSPNMGSATIRPLTATFALLNVRLGYWLRNPKNADPAPTVLERLFDIRSLLLLKEVFSRISENSKTVYLTDGGNLENLGLHALLKRKCKLIIAIDAEADPLMRFTSFLKLERYARIDLGTLIDLPWQAISTRTLEVDAALAAKQPIVASGCHVAACDIRYGPTERGVLLYVKASLTGDETDYILDYKLRHPEFPHETTGDQFFGEEQLEVYRALGFHIMCYVLEQRAKFEVKPPVPGAEDAERARLWAEIERLLLGKPAENPPPDDVAASGSAHPPQVPVHDQPGDDAGEQRDRGGDRQDGEVPV